MALLFGAAPIFTACDKVKSEKDVEVTHPDGTKEVEKQQTVQKPDGTLVTNKESATTTPAP